VLATRERPARSARPRGLLRRGRVRGLLEGADWPPAAPRRRHLALDRARAAWRRPPLQPRRPRHLRRGHAVLARAVSLRGNGQLRRDRALGRLAVLVPGRAGAET